MGEYIKPVALTNDDLAEGVFLGSGGNTNITGPLVFTPSWGPDNILHLNVKYTGTGEEDTYTLHQYVVTFNEPVSVANALGEDINCSGNILTINRTFEFSSFDNEAEFVINCNEPHTGLPSVTSYN